MVEEQVNCTLFTLLYFEKVAGRKRFPYYSTWLHWPVLYLPTVIDKFPSFKIDKIPEKVQERIFISFEIWETG